ncbi:ATP-binding cassette domain-containing protein [Campylobacter lari]|uniref:ATP-binding cassette domain-containing protein n=1 Tax=Campylobacter lari TaxID=201 RepID=A0A7U8G1S5_CAMLA|nr:ATP-binding cassette domain-containing protein [Campylobacter lari]
MIELKNIEKKYNKKTIVKDININFEKGKLTSIIGSNGAGKSTVLSLASRLIKADKGEIIINGKNINTYKENNLAQILSILKQQNNLNIKLTIEDLVAFGRFPYSQGKINNQDKDKINEAIKYMNLEDIKDRYLDTLSGGQKQRAFIAMIIAQDTEYIFLDEPLNNLDMQHSVSIMKIIKNLATECNKGIIVVLHDINFASIYSDHIVAMKNGIILQSGNTNEVINTPNLKEIFDMEISIQTINNKKFCLYYE